MTPQIPTIEEIVKIEESAQFRDSREYLPSQKAVACIYALLRATESAPSEQTAFDGILPKVVSPWGALSTPRIDYLGSSFFHG